MRNDSADGRTVEAHSEAFSGGAYSRWASWTQADLDPSCAGSGTVDSQHRCAMAHAAAKLSELQNCASPLSNLVLHNLWRSTSSKPPTQDRRRLSRYVRRWLVERFFAWIQWQRRILVRWEYHAQNFLGFGVLQKTQRKEGNSKWC